MFQVLGLFRRENWESVSCEIVSVLGIFVTQFWEASWMMFEDVRCWNDQGTKSNWQMPDVSKVYKTAGRLSYTMLSLWQ